MIFARLLGRAASAEDLLGQLRRLDRRVDWRRDRAAAEAGSLSAALAEARRKGRHSPADLAEAEALVAKLSVDAVTALEALSELVRLDAPGQRRDWALNELMHLGVTWRLAREGLTGTAREDAQRRAEEALSRLAADRPTEAVPHLVLADIMSLARGPFAAVTALERGLVAGERVAQRLLHELLNALVARPGKEAVDLAMSPPEEAQRAAGDTWLAFRFHRAVALATIGWHLRSGTPPRLPRPRADALDAALVSVPPEEMDPTICLEAALKPLDRFPPPRAVRHLIALADYQPTRVSLLPDAEAARHAVLRQMLAALGTAPANINIGVRLITVLARTLPECITFWENREFRRAACDIALRAIDAMPADKRLEAPAAILALAREDLDRAKVAITAVATTQPDAAGYGTYVDPRDIPDILRNSRSGRKLGEEGLSFRLIAEGPAAVASAPGPVVVVSGNDRYLRQYGVAYAQALQQQSRHGHLHVHLIGDPELLKDDIVAIAAAAPDYRVTLSAEPVTIAQPYYFATARFLRLGFFLERLGRAIVATDIDWHWRTDPASLLASDRMSGVDVALRLGMSIACGRQPRHYWPGLSYPLVQPWTAVNANGIFLAPTSGARRFAEMLGSLADAELRRAAERRGTKWCIDQNILYAAYAHSARAHPEIVFTDLGHPHHEPTTPAIAERLAGLTARHWVVPPAG